MAKLGIILTTIIIFLSFFIGNSIESIDDEDWISEINGNEQDSSTINKKSKIINKSKENVVQKSLKSGSIPVSNSIPTDPIPDKMLEESITKNVKDELEKNKKTFAQKYVHGVYKLGKFLIGGTLSLSQKIAKHTGNVSTSMAICHEIIPLEKTSSSKSIWLFAKSIQNDPNVGSILFRLYNCGRKGIVQKLLENMIISNEALPGIIEFLLKTDADSQGVLKFLSEHESKLTDDNWIAIGNNCSKESNLSNIVALLEKSYNKRFDPWRLNSKSMKIFKMETKKQQQNKSELKNQQGNVKKMENQQGKANSKPENQQEEIRKMEEFIKKQQEEYKAKLKKTTRNQKSAIK